MTSGEFHRIHVDKIFVARDERQRRELKDIESLANSIKRIGLIHPLVIDRNYKLCSGERRLSAIKSLGHDFVMCQFLDELEPRQQRRVELEENIKRVDLTWEEQRAAVLEYNDLSRLLDNKWKPEQTAEALGLSDGNVSKYLTISEEAKIHPEILELETQTTAYKKALDNRKKRGEAQMQGVFSIPEEEKAKSIIHANFLEWAPKYDGLKFNFLHIDFPYGIDTDERGQGNAPQIVGAYDDSAPVYWGLLSCLCNNLNRICADSAHIMFWFSMHYYADTLAFFANNSNFTIDPFPLIWLKSDGRGMLPDPQRGPRRIYETCLFGSRGDRKIVGSVANAYAAPTESSNKIHISIKPEPVLRHFFKMFIDENSTVFDPTCGSGSALRAAESYEAAFVLGLESNAQFAEDATRLLEASRRLRKASASAM